VILGSCLGRKLLSGAGANVTVVITQFLLRMRKRIRNSTGKLFGFRIRVIDL
jgi:hypothetical protein